MIDIAYEVQKFRPVDISAIPTDDKYGENVRLAFALYNKAIQKINNGYEDLARIDLKKTVQLHPNFYVAIILLGMCTFANGDRIGAVRIFNSVKDPDMREKALNYLDYLASEMDKVSNRNAEYKEIREDEIFSVKLHGTSDVNKSFDKFEVFEVDDSEDQVTLKIEPFNSIENKPEKEEVKEVVQEVVKNEVKTETKKVEPVKESKASSYVIPAEKSKPEIKENVNNGYDNKKLLVISYAVIFIIIVVLGIVTIKAKSENKELKEALSLYTDTEGTTKPTPTPTEQKVTNTPTNSTPSPTPVDYYSLTASQVKECVRQFNFKQYYNVVEIYHTIKMDYVPEGQKENLKKVYNSSLENFTKQNYSYAFTLSSQKKYEEAIDVLLPILKYNPDFANYDAVLFYVGKAYEDSKNNSKAKEYYNIVIDKYSSSDYANWAAYRLKVIG